MRRRSVKDELSKTTLALGAFLKAQAEMAKQRPKAYALAKSISSHLNEYAPSSAIEIIFQERVAKSMAADAMVIDVHLLTMEVDKLVQLYTLLDKGIDSGGELAIALHLLNLNVTDEKNTTVKEKTCLKSL